MVQRIRISCGECGGTIYTVYARDEEPVCKLRDAVCGPCYYMKHGRMAEDSQETETIDEQKSMGAFA